MALSTHHAVHGTSAYPPILQVGVTETEVIHLESDKPREHSCGNIS